MVGPLRARPGHPLAGAGKMKGIDNQAERKVKDCVSLVLIAPGDKRIQLSEVGAFE
jgi:hypothetical protein